MANKSLTDLTARTATADSDLLHINSGGTDYQQTKADFCKGIVTKITFNNTSTLTSQCEALANQNYTGYISSAGHVTETGVPEDTYYWVFVYKQGSNNIRIEIKELASAGRSYHNTKTTQGWSGWILDPTREEITDMVTYTSLAPILKNGWSLNGASYYGKIGDLGFVQVGIRNGTMNTVGFTLPNGYKPNEALIVPILTAAGIPNGYAYFETSGDVTFYSQTYNSGAYFNAIYRRA